jgi:hypothetical protein
VTARQDKRGIKVTSDDNQWFEALAIAMIERTSTAVWENAIALWRGLDTERSSVWPSTRNRILRRMLEVTAVRGDPWSAKLVRRFAEVTIPAFADTKARGRVHDAEGLRKAARHKARHPQASWNELAKAAGVPRDTVRQWCRVEQDADGQWRGRADFEKYVADEKVLIKAARDQRQRVSASDEGFYINGKRVRP